MCNEWCFLCRPQTFLRMKRLFRCCVVFSDTACSSTRHLTSLRPPLQHQKPIIHQLQQHATLQTRFARC